jgi:uncharacterized protein YndB with AHSA1/START domain
MTESTTEPRTVLRIERTYDAPAQALFNAWTNPDVIARWWHPGADWTTPEAEVDVRVGGAVRVVMRSPDGELFGGGGEYTEVEPPRRLAFTWTWDDEAGRRASLVELDFTADDGSTTVVLTHSGLASEESRDGHADGWRQALENLAGVVQA